MIVGTDAAVSMLRVACDQVPGMHVVAVLPVLSYRRCTFDAATLGFVLSHIADMDGAFREIRRVLKPNGQVALSAWSLSPGDSPPGHLLDELRTAGFHDCQVEQRSYSIVAKTDEYIDSRLISMSARCLYFNLPQREWAAFVARARQVMKGEFGEKVSFGSSVNLAVARNASEPSSRDDRI